MTRPLRRALLAVAALTLAGCPIGNNKFPKPVDLSPSWRIDKLRVLGVRAEPPEARPGQRVTFEALVIDPDGESGGAVWIACPPAEDGGTGFGCGLSSDLDFAAGSDQGIIGFQPGLDPVYTPPDDILDDLEEEERAEGTYQLIQLAVIPEGLLDEGFGEGDFGADIDFNQVEVGYKRLVVSEARTPNRNPEVAGFAVDGWSVPADATIEVDPGETYALDLFLPAQSIERYTFERDDGTLETRREEPFITWYASGGTLLETETLFPYLDVTWQAPEADAEVTSGSWWTVVRDRRGGMAWAERRWRLRGTAADTDG